MLVHTCRHVLPGVHATHAPDDEQYEPSGQFALTIHALHTDVPLQYRVATGATGHVGHVVEPSVLHGEHVPDDAQDVPVVHCVSCKHWTHALLD